MAQPISISSRRWRLPDLPVPHGHVPSVDEAAMLAADRAATDRVGISLLQMMENAGHALADLTRLTLGGSVVGRSIVVLAGTGNNAGGGMVAARRLAGWGADACLVFARPILRLRPGPCAQVEPMLAAGVRAAVAGHDRLGRAGASRAWATWPTSDCRPPSSTSSGSRPANGSPRVPSCALAEARLAMPVHAGAAGQPRMSGRLTVRSQMPTATSAAPRMSWSGRS